MKTRKQLVKIIAGLLPERGYDGFVAHWNVKIPYVDLSEFDDAVAGWQKDIKGDYGFHGASLELIAKALELARVKWPLGAAERFDDAATETMRDDLSSDSYRMVSPKIEKRFGLMDGEIFDIKFEFRGRNGGHLCLIEFEGLGLDSLGEREDFLAYLADKEAGEFGLISLKWLSAFAAYLVEAETMFSCRSIADEYRYQFLFAFNGWLEDFKDAAEERLRIDRMAEDLRGGILAGDLIHGVIRAQGRRIIKAGEALSSGDDAFVAEVERICKAYWLVTAEQKERKYEF